MVHQLQSITTTIAYISSMAVYGTADFHYLGSDTAPYTVSPDLPSGLNLDWSSGKISGTPRELSTSTIYTITARNAHGSDTATLTISVNAPPSLSYDLGTGNSTSVYSNKQVAAGYQHTCAILDNGSVMCWGANALWAIRRWWNRRRTHTRLG